jgi:hypothetical protein
MWNEGAMVQRYNGSRVQRFKGTEVQRFSSECWDKVIILNNLRNTSIWVLIEK